MVSTKFVFFDLGWTLEDETEAQLDRASKAAALLAKYGVETTPDEILQRQDQGARIMTPSVFMYALSSLGLSQSQVATVVAEARWDRERLCLYPDALPVLKALSMKHRLGLIANQSGGTDARLRRYGIRGYFQIFLASDETGIVKPESRIFDHALKLAGCRAEDAWMVGDRLDNDIRPARQAGWRTIRVLQGYNALQLATEPAHEPDYTVKNLRQILSILA